MNYFEYKKRILENPKAKILNFESDSRIHYVYRVTDKRKPLHYYGSKTEKHGVDKETIGCGYYTSSKDTNFRNDFKMNPCYYKVKIIRYFDNPGDKILFESYIHQKFKVKDNFVFANITNQTPWGFDTTGNVAIRSKLKEINSVINLDPKRFGRKCKKISKANSKIVYQYDLNGNFISSFLSQKEAAEYLGYSNTNGISLCVNGKIPRHKNYMWSTFKNSRLKPYKKNNGRVVYQYDLNGNFIKEFSSRAEAARQLGYKFSTGINDCANGLYPSYLNYMWKNEKV